MIARSTLDSLSDAILAHLAADPDLIGSLAAETGIAPADLRAAAGDPGEGFAAALVDFICGSDERLTGFAAASGWRETEVARVRAALDAGMIAR